MYLIYLLNENKNCNTSNMLLVFLLQSDYDVSFKVCVQVENVRAPHCQLVCSPDNKTMKEPVPLNASENFHVKTENTVFLLCPQKKKYVMKLCQLFTTCQYICNYGSFFFFLKCICGLLKTITVSFNASMQQNTGHGDDDTKSGIQNIDCFHMTLEKLKRLPQLDYDWKTPHPSQELTPERQH